MMRERRAHRCVGGGLDAWSSHEVNEKKQIREVEEQAAEMAGRGATFILSA
jgi:hypothetical protein